MLFASVCVCVHAPVHACVCVSVCVHAPVHVCVCARARVCTRAYAFVHVHEFHFLSWGTILDWGP